MDACVHLKPCLAKQHKICVFPCSVLQCLLCMKCSCGASSPRCSTRPLLFLEASHHKEGELKLCSRKGGRKKNRKRNCEDNSIVPMPLDSIRTKPLKGLRGCKLLSYWLICHACERSMRGP